MRLSGKPSPLAIAALIGLLWTASSRAMRDFIWADLREGMLDLRGLPPNSRRLARAGLVVLGTIIVALLFNDFWRANSSLVALTGSRIFRGQLLPLGLLPMTLFLLVIAWSFVLTGALHSHWAIRLSFLVIYELSAIGWANSLVASGGTTERWIAFGSIVAVAAVFALRWRAHPRPVLEFAALFALVSILLLLAQGQELRTLRLFGIPIGLAKISFNVNFLGGLITPLLLLIGMNIADFTRRAAHWVSDTLTARTPRKTALLIFAILLGWRWFFSVQETLAQSARIPAREQLFGLLGALGELVAVGLVWWIVARLRPPHESEMSTEVERWARPLVLTYSAVQLAIFLLLALLMAVASGAWFEETRAFLFTLIDQLSGRFTEMWHLALSGAMLALALWLARRHRGGLALYLGIFGALQLWWNVTSRGHFLGFLGGGGQDAIALWWTFAVTVAAAWWTWRRALTPERVTRLVLLLFILTLMRQRDFIENPFSPFFGFAGIAFIAFSLVWDIATSGAWTNADSPRLPRSSRVFLYLGAILLTATLLNWAVTIHDLDTVEKFTGGTALVGFDRFGKPLLYATFAIALALPAAARRGRFVIAFPKLNEVTPLPSK